MQSDPLVKVSSTSERFAKMRAQREGVAVSAAATPSDDPLAHFQAEHHAQIQKRQSDAVTATADGSQTSATGEAAAANAPNQAATAAGATTSTPVKKPPKVPERLEVTASALAAAFLEGCEKEVGERADQRAWESIDGLLEVAQRGAWAHVRSGAPAHLSALQSKAVSEDDAYERLSSQRTLAVLQLVAYVQLGQFAQAARSIREELRCTYTRSLEATEAKGIADQVTRNIAELEATDAQVDAEPSSSTSEAEASPSDDYNIPVAALMVHAELPYGLHRDSTLVINRVQTLMRAIDAHAAKLEGAESGTVGYSDAEMRAIAKSTGAIAGYSPDMSQERLRDAYCALVAGARSPGSKMPSLLPDHFAPLVLMDRVQCCAWRLRLLEVLVGYCIPARRTMLAIKMCQEVYTRTSRYLEYARAAHPLSIFSVALTRIARILTCTGAMDIAAPLLDYVNESTPSEGPEANALQLEMAMLQFARRNYSEAMHTYKKVLQECIHNSHDSTHEASFVVDPPGFSGRMIAANNFAICCVHNCCVADGILELERLLQSDPARFFRKEILFNLCTLYDLALSKRMSLMKKTALKMVGDKYFLSHLQRKHYLLQ